MRFAALNLARFVRFFVARAHRFEGDRNVYVFTVTDHLQLDGHAWTLLSDLHLKLASVGDLLSIELDNYVADFQAAFGCGRIGFDLGYDRAAGIAHVEELGVLRRHVSNSDSHVAMCDFAIPNQRVDRRLHDLRGNCKPHARELPRRGNQKRIDADHFPVRIHQRTTGVARIDRSIRLDELARFARVIGKWIRTIQCADNPARHGEAKPEWISKRQYSLPRMQRSRVSPGNAG